MGLYYSVRIYIKKENLSKSLQWLFENTSKDNDQLTVLVDDDPIPCNGSHFRLKGYGQTNKIEINESIAINDNFQSLYYSTSLLLDLEPKLMDYYLGPIYNENYLEHFQEQFNELYDGKGKIRVGYFKASILKLSNSQIFEFNFQGVTSGMSCMLEESMSVRKWIYEFSDASESVLSYIDMESSGIKIIYYKGHKTEIILKNSIPKSSLYTFQNLLTDYFHLENDLELNNDQKYSILTENINVVEDDQYSVFIANAKWYLDIRSGYNEQIELNENQITRFRKEGKKYMDDLVEIRLNIHRYSKKREL
ncbi:hypothetical protein [Flavobacterium sp. CAU 1735]|uniref:hypothetical protein n=1 Tax=Flavobacterium sp. CAU 1735 TaxID=3140361 RepID=UPI003260A1E2